MPIATVSWNFGSLSPQPCRAEAPLMAIRSLRSALQSTPSPVQRCTPSRWLFSLCTSGFSSLFRFFSLKTVSAISAFLDQPSRSPTTPILFYHSLGFNACPRSSLFYDPLGLYFYIFIFSHRGNKNPTINSLLSLWAGWCVEGRKEGQCHARL